MIHVLYESLGPINYFKKTSMYRFAIKRNIKFNNFYFAREIKGIYPRYLYDMKEAKDTDLFVMRDFETLEYALSSEKLNYFYDAGDGYILARTIPIKGIEKYNNIRPINKYDIKINY